MNIYVSRHTVNSKAIRICKSIRLIPVTISRNTVNVKDRIAIEFPVFRATNMQLAQFARDTNLRQRFVGCRIVEVFIERVRQRRDRRYDRYRNIGCNTYSNYLRESASILIGREEEAFKIYLG